MKFKLSIAIILLLIYFPGNTQDLPKRELERNIAASKVYTEEKAEKKEEAYKKWIRKYPPERFLKSLSFYEYVETEVGKAFAIEGNIKKATSYVKGIAFADGWAEIAGAMEVSGYLDDAIGLYKSSRSLTIKAMKLPEGESKLKALAGSLIKYSNSIARVLFRQKKFIEALPFANEAYQESNKSDAETNIRYAEILIALEKYDTAFSVLESMMYEQMGSIRVKNLLRQTYMKFKDPALYDSYIKNVQVTVHKKRKDDLRKEMIRIEAPAFSLPDLDGFLVSLSDYKGKIVVIDFWAIWCVPCRQSFPFMQKAVDRFKDSSMHFLFIHTREQMPHATKDARDYIQKNSFNFHVLMDLKDPVTEVNNIVEAFKVSALPAKFMVDKNGKIRFIIDHMRGDLEVALEDFQIMKELVEE